RLRGAEPGRRHHRRSADGRRALFVVVAALVRAALGVGAAAVQAVVGLAEAERAARARAVVGERRAVARGADGVALGVREAGLFIHAVARAAALREAALERNAAVDGAGRRGRAGRRVVGRVERQRDSRRVAGALGMRGVLGLIVVAARLHAALEGRRRPAARAAARAVG